MSRSNPVKPESPSKIFREVLYSLWNQDNDGFDTFDSFYEDRMSKLIKHYRKQIKKK